MTRKTFSMSRSTCKPSLSLTTEPGMKICVGTTSAGKWTHLKTWVGLAWTFNFGKGGDGWQGLNVCPYTQMSWWHRTDGVSKSGGQWSNGWELPQASLSSSVSDLCSPEGCSKHQGPQPALTPTLMTFLEGEDLIESTDVDPQGSIFSVLLSELGRQVLLMRKKRCVYPVSDSQGC